MHLIFCVDEKDGLSFCGRRLSRDREVYAHILRICEGHLLWTAPNSAILFPKDSVMADFDFLKKASLGDYCFVENPLQTEAISGLESVILYHWNRHYPSTEKFSRSLLDGMRLIETVEFPGSSHDNITMERYAL